MTQHALTWDGDQLALRPFAPRPLADGEARLQPRLMGICNTDLELMAGYRGFRGRLGHEFVADVIEGPQVWRGARVVGEINIGCGTCDLCERGEKSQCRNRQALGISSPEGAFASSFILPVANLHRVPDNVTDEAAVFTEPLAAACRITQLHAIGPKDRVVLIGAGKLGLLCAQVIARTGADLTVIIRRQAQAEQLASWGIQSVKRDEFPDGMADFAVDCTGTPEGFNAALEMVRPRGTLILKSTFHGLTSANLTAVAVREIRVEGSRCGPFDTALDMLAAGTIKTDTMIDGIFPIADFAPAFEAATQAGALKILLQN